MKVLLAGASGAIGRYLVPQLINAKHEVIGITRTPGSLAGTGAREVVADVLDRAGLLAALEGIKANAVIHQLTSLRNPPTTLRSMRETNRLRTEGTSALIAAARKVGAHKLVAGSFFGGYGLFDHGSEPLTESAPFGEIDGRADSVQRALLSLEQQVHAFGGVSLRFGLFYDSTTSAVSPVSRTWDGLLPMLHVSDAAAATVRALTKYKAGAVYNIADDHPMTYRAREVARAAAAADVRPPTRLSDGLIRLVAPFAGLLLTRASLTLSTARAATELGWKPQYPSLLECLEVDAPAEPLVLHVAARRAFPVEDEDVEPDPTPAPVPELVEGPAPDPTPASDPTPVPELVEGPGSDPTPVPELVEGPDPAPTPVPELVEGPDPDPTPASDPTPVPELVEGPDPAPVPELVEGPASDPTPVPELVEGPDADPFADMDSAIARIGQPHDE
jgi:nucleoside-diphosphate-sugar epimerase